MDSTKMKQKAIDLFVQLVKIDSLSFEEKNIFEFIQRYLSHKNVKVVMQDYVDNKLHSSNLLVYLEGNDKSKKNLFFDAHVDTVVPGKNISPIVDEKYIRSSGDTILGADDKTSVTAMLIAIDEILENNLSHGDLLFLFTSAEEVGLIGAQHIDVNILKGYDYGYILDWGGDIGSICSIAPSRGVYDITVKGRSAHAGRQANGINAIQIAGEMIALLPQGHLSSNTVTNIATITGGGTMNIVPDTVHILGEYRSVDMGELQGVEEKINSAINTVLDNYKNTPVQISCDYERLTKGYVIDEEEDILKFTHKALKNLEVSPNNITIFGGTSANIYRDKEIPCVPISGGGRYFPHELNEEVIIEEFPNLILLILSLVDN